MDKSTNKVEVLVVDNLRDHPGADNLQIFEHDNYVSIVRKDEFMIGCLVAFVPPDTIVPTNHPDFAFLAHEGRSQERIKAKRLRGIVSHGLLIKAPKGSEIGDDVAELLGVSHYDPEIYISTQTDNCSGPKGLYYEKYDVDSIKKYRGLLVEGEIVYVSEKVHGANSKYVYNDGQLYVGSRTGWKKEDERSPWWIAYKNIPAIGRFCEANPSCIMFGEIFGRVQSLRYGYPNTVMFVAFDIMENGIWYDYIKFRETCNMYEIPTVPELYIGPYSWEKMVELAEGKSAMPNCDNIKEGIVCKPIRERRDPHIGRVCLKLVSDSYLLSKH